MSKSAQFTQLSQSVVKTLLYYDLFSYPLSATEVYNNLQTNHVSEADVANELKRLSETRILFQCGEFFSMQNDDTLVKRRIDGNKMALKYLRIASRRARWIYQFPFVRAVMVSGSLSKNYADDHTDIDFFIVTSPGRLWVARTLLVMFKRIFLLNSHKFFCVNYFIDEDHLEIEEKNLFTATELSTLLPLRGLGVYDKLIRSNSWIHQILPNARRNALTPLHATDQTGLLKMGMEGILLSGPGKWLEKRFRQLSQRRWRKRYGDQLSPGDFEVAFKSTEFVSKNHPNNHQRTVMDRYRRRLEEFALSHTWKWVYD